jgi:hypothetical protein
MSHLSWPTSPISEPSDTDDVISNMSLSDDEDGAVQTIFGRSSVAVGANDAEAEARRVLDAVVALELHTRATMRATRGPTARGASSPHPRPRACRTASRSSRSLSQARIRRHSRCSRPACANAPALAPLRRSGATQTRSRTRLPRPLRPWTRTKTSVRRLSASLRTSNQRPACAGFRARRHAT